MRFLVIGQGGREHALCWKLAHSEVADQIYCAPGNPGTAALVQNVPISVTDIDALRRFALDNAIDITVVGPEQPLELGIVDAFNAAGLAIFGPTKAAAALETSKSFAKSVMQAAGVPTADYETFNDQASAAAYAMGRAAPMVIKADGLAAGKGVFVCKSHAEADDALKQLYSEFRAQKVIIEDFLDGREASFIAAVCGDHIIPLAVSHDYKRIRDNDSGPNTGGMGTVSPSPNLPAERDAWVVECVMRPVIEEMRRRGAPFAGFLYAGLMVLRDGSIKVLEFNTRLGDPETQVIMRRLRADLGCIFRDLLEGDCPETISWSKNSAVCVVLASAGYPESSSKGDVISGIEQASELPECVVFHAGTALANSHVVTAGGRVLNVTALGENVAQARARAYQAADLISFQGLQRRNDIAK